MKNWKTTLGGSISSAGTTLAGIGTLSQFSDLEKPEKRLLFYVAAVGVALSALGKFFASLWAEDVRTGGVTEASKELRNSGETHDNH